MNKIINNNGFTALELLIVIAITGILAAVAIPSFKSMIEQNRLKQALESVKSDLELARTRAIKTNSNVVFSLRSASTSAGNWCYGLTTKAAGCDCTQAANAGTGCEIKLVSAAADFATIKFGSATQYHITSDFRRGTASGATFPLELPFSSASLYGASVYLSEVGRVRICAPFATATGETALPGLTC